VGDQDAVVFVVDDDLGMREGIRRLLRSVGLDVRTFRSAGEFLDGLDGNAVACVVLDVRLPGMSGLELQTELARVAPNLPIIFMSAHGDVSMTVRAMKGGATEFLTKPFRDQDLLEAVAAAIDQARAAKARDRETAQLQARFDTLTRREWEVLDRVVAGRLNKQIAQDLGISEVTVKIHRSHVMQKTGARHVVDLVRMAERVSPRRPPPSPRPGARPH
jgi:FixJ family two-component response regulator